MKKRGAIHVDWVISMAIFFIYLIVLLVLIKPSYKPRFEGEVLTNMVKDEFLKQNERVAGFVFYTLGGCKQGDWYVPGIVDKINEKFEGTDEEIKIGKGNIYVDTDPVSFSPEVGYNAYFLDYSSFVSNFDYGNICDEAKIGEVFYYNGLREKQDLKFTEENFDFPSSRKYKITVYGEDFEDEIEISSLGEPTSDDKVYVLELSSSVLYWQDNKIKREPVLINIQVW